MKYSRIVVLAGMLAGMAACPAHGDVLNGLFARYSFEGNANDSVGSNHGTMMGGASTVVDPVRGNVLSLDGADDYVALPSAGLAAGRSNITVSVWIKPDEWVASNAIYDEYGGDWGEFWQFSIYEGKWYTRDTSTGPTGSRTNDASLPAVPAGQWHHLAFVYSVPQQLKLVYYDGVLYDTQIAPFPLTTDRAGAAIGYPCDGAYFDGQMDELRFYNRALTVSEIATLAAVQTYALTVNSGSGDGTYAPGVVVDIAADPAPSGMGFSRWTGDTAGVGNVNAPVTTYTMPAFDAAITATYATAYTLTVNSGTGGGNYAAGAVVTITANGGPSGYVFDRWTGNTAPLANPAAMTTTVTMPASAVTVTAHYVAFIGYQLTVVSGTGSGYYDAGAVINLTADAAPSGQVFNMWAGDPDGFDSWTEMEMSSATYVMPARNMTLTATYRTTVAPVDWWPYFNAFCKTEFGAAVEPLTYTMFGDDLAFLTGTDSQWRHISETSACITFETNLPSKGWIEYGPTMAYGSTTPDPDRYYYLNIRHLTGLANNTPYHYRFVAQDERGNVIASEDKTFTTATPANVIYVPAGVSGPPYNLSTAGRTYLLTQDLVCNRTAFEVQANDVTLDLGGHTVVYDQENYQVTENYRDTSSIGVRAVSRTGLKVVNGIIKQGLGYNIADDSALGYSPVTLWSCTGELAGVSVEYAGAQVTGIRLDSSPMNAHHCVILDRGGDIDNRHLAPTAILNGSSVHHNLVNRHRQMAFSAVNGTVYYNNEIYVDSCATNGCGILVLGKQTGDIFGNRIFGTGYLMIGVSTAGTNTTDIMVHDNFVHLQATRPDDRWPEYGAQSGAYCFRITGYGGAMDNVQFYDNVGVTYGRDGGMVRGTWFTAQTNVTDCVFRDNILKAVLTTLDSNIQGCVVHVGDQDVNCAPIVYSNNRLISNFCNARMGEDYYGAGQNAEFYGNTFVKEGPDRPDYRTIGVGYENLMSIGHKFFDSVFEPGAGYDHVRWDGSGARSIYVGWTLTVQTEPNAGISVRDSTNAVVWTGQADQNGLASKELYEYLQQPGGKTFYTPHQVTASLGGNNRTVSVTLDARKTVEVYLHDRYTLTVNSGTGDGTYDAATVVAIAADAPASGMVFDAWTGDTAGIADPHAASTTITMPAANVAITATYEAVPQLLGDLNGDNFVGQGDLNIVLAQWGRGLPGNPAITDPRADANHDGFVGQGDLNIVLADWGESAS